MCVYKVAVGFFSGILFSIFVGGCVLFIRWRESLEFSKVYATDSKGEEYLVEIDRRIHPPQAFVDETIDILMAMSGIAFVLGVLLCAVFMMVRRRKCKSDNRQL